MNLQPLLKNNAWQWIYNHHWKTMHENESIKTIEKHGSKMCLTIEKHNTERIVYVNWKTTLDNVLSKNQTKK